MTPAEKSLTNPSLVLAEVRARLIVGGAIIELGQLDGMSPDELDELVYQETHG